LKEWAKEEPEVRYIDKKDLKNEVTYIKELA